MSTPIDMEVDVTEAAGLGERAHTKASVLLPDPSQLGDPPIVCFAFPGGGYSRGYYTFDMPGASGGGQAGWHTQRGWIFVACDHLGVGESSLPNPNSLQLENVSRANHATVQHVLARLAEGALADGFPPLATPLILGIGQSMGGCLTVVQQAQHGTYDGIGVLGFSAIHTFPPAPSGEPAVPLRYIPRGSDPENPTIVNAEEFSERLRQAEHASPPEGPHVMAWCFYHDDVPEEIVRRDLEEFPTRKGKLPPWASATVPGLGALCLTPGVIAPEAAAIRVPVLLASGERDVVPDPWLEAKAYKGATDITLFVCPRMGHMHNFASTRELLWARIETWGHGLAAARNV